MTEIAGFSHVSLSVRDRQASQAFYGRLFGFAPINEIAGDNWAGTVTAHPSGAILTFLQHDDNDGTPFDERRTGLDHLAINVATRVELDGWQARLAEHGVQHSPIAEQPYGAVLCLRDPDGIQVELFCMAGA